MRKRLHALFCLVCLIMFSGVVKAQLNASFTANITSGCAPFVVQFTNTSTGSNISGYYWDFGNGNTSSLTNPSTTYLNAGSFTVLLVAFSGSQSDTERIVGYVNAYPKPVVNFITLDSNFQCGPKPITYTDASVLGAPGPAVYQWDFGGGTVLTGPSVTYNYSTLGPQSLTLSVTNSLGCSNSITKNGYVHFVTAPVASFSSTNPNSCVVPTSVTFTNNSQNAINYFWNFGPGTSTQVNPTYNYTTAGTYDVMLVASNQGCSDTFTQSAYANVGTQLVAGFTSSDDTVCVNEAISFTNTSVPGVGGSTWYFGDATTSNDPNPTKAYTTAGTYTVKLVMNYISCVDTAVKVIVVNPGPTADFVGGPVLTACQAPLTVNFTNQTTGGTGYTYLWSFGQGGATSTQTNPSRTYNGTGNFTVSLTATNPVNGCSNTMTKNAYVRINSVAPSANFAVSPTSGCQPLVVNFDGSVIPVPTFTSITSYSWDFGDGSPLSTSPNPTHTYSNIGTDTVKLTFTVAAGCTYTRQRVVTVNPKPTASFSVVTPSICLKDTFLLTNSSTGATNVTWYVYPSGSPMTGFYQYVGDTVKTRITNPGTYNVSLIASNDGCSDTLTLTDTLRISPPSANFTVGYSCTDRKQISLTNNSLGATSYLWDFGDNSTPVTSASPVYTYASNGNYQVRLISTNSSSGCTDTARINVRIYNLNPSFTAISDTAICKGQTVNFQAVQDTNATSYGWQYEANTFPQTSGSFIGTNTYNSVGVYSVALILTDSRGCKDTAKKTNYVLVSGPTAAFTTSNPISGCAPLTVTFTDASTTSPTTTPISARDWFFGDNTTVGGNLTSTSKTYTVGGSYTVKLRVTAGSCMDSVNISTPIEVSKPNAKFMASDSVICRGKTINFTTGTFANPTYPNPMPNPWSFQWNFGGGGTPNTTSLRHPSVQFATNGNYTVRLIVTSNLGCKDTFIKTNYIQVAPLNVKFTISDTIPTCPPKTVSFTNTSASAAQIFAWTFGNGNNSTFVSPSATYTQGGVYNIRLIGKTADMQCVDTFNKVLTVLGPSGSISYSPLQGCSPMPINLTATLTNASSYVWDLNNGFVTSPVTLTSPNQTVNSTATYTTYGKYRPFILATSGGCNVPIFGTDTVKVDKIISNFTIIGNNQCGSGNVTFKDTILNSVAGLQSVWWSFGDATTGTGSSPTHFYSTPGVYEVKMGVVSNFGCIDTVTKYVTIKPKPTVSAGNNAIICPASATTLGASGAGVGGSYTWSPATGLSNVNISNPVASPATTTTYTVTGTAANGCTNTSQVTVTVATPPTVTAGANQTICSGGYATLIGQGAITYTWSVQGGGPTTSLSCTSCQSTSANPSATTAYVVTGVDLNNCIGKDTVIVNVSTLPTVSGGPNRTICIGGNVALAASAGSAGSSTTSYTWTLLGGQPATTLSCTNCLNPIASPSVTTTYRVSAIGLTGPVCSDTAIVTVTVAPLPSISAGANQTICFGQSATLQATGAGLGGTYLWSPASELSTPNAATTIATPTSAGLRTYTVTGTSIAGCNNTSSVTITVNAKPNVVINSGNNLELCVNSSAVLNATGASIYSWSPSLGLSATNISSPTATPLSSITYSVIGENSFGCLDTATIDVTVNALPLITASGTATICPGGSAPIAASGGVSYSWTPALGLNNPAIATPVASPSGSTTYTVTGTDANGCSNTDQVLISVTAPPNVAAGGNQTICIGASAQLLATGAVTYSWTPSATLNAPDIPDPIATPTDTTTYTVIGTDAIGCSSSAQMTVNVNPLPAIDAGPNVSVCTGGSVTLTATGGQNYVWIPASGLSCTACATTEAAPQVTTTYTVTGTDAIGCVNSDFVTVTPLPLPTVSVTPSQTACPGVGVPLQATGATSYSWTPTSGLSNPNIANPIATPVTATTYTVTGTDANGCVNTASTTISLHPIPNINAGPNVSICIGGSVTLQATGGSNYVWLPDPTLSCTNCPNPVASPTVTKTYTVTGVSPQGCADTGTITVTVNPKPIINAGNDTTICAGAPVTLAPGGGVSYVWSPASGLSCTSCTNPVATVFAPKTFYVTGTDANGCSNIDSIKISIFPTVPVNAGPDRSVCPGDTVHLKASGAVTYSWTPATGLSCTNCANPVANPASTTSYVVTGTNAIGCTRMDTVVVTVFPQPNISAGSNKTICRGDSVQLQATGGVTYAWSPGGSLSCTNCANPFARPTQNTNYRVIGRNANGCIDTAFVTVNVTQRNSVSIRPGDSVCQGKSVQLQASGGDGYVWTPATGLSDPSIANPVATPNATTTYQVVVSQGQCFKDTGRVVVTVVPLPTVDAGPDLRLVLGSTLTLQPQVSGAVTYLWTPSTALSCTTCPNPVAEPKVTTTYTIKVSNALGCSAQDNVTVSVSCDNSYLSMPNTFTPNNDGHNDKLFPQGSGISKIRIFRVYNRWGQLMYEVNNVPPNDARFGWDGSFKGEVLNSDVFVFYILGQCETGETQELKGDVTLIR